MWDEVDTKNIITMLEKIKKNMYFPQVISETEMILVNKNNEIYQWEIDIFFVPWRAFSFDWKRLWRGKWYYDRFLTKKKYNTSTKVGLCYDFQIFEDIPIETHDISVNHIIYA